MARPSQSNDYRHTCLALHGKVSLQVFGQLQDLKKVEATTRTIRSSRHLTYEDIESIKNQELWNGAYFWR